MSAFEYLFNSSSLDVVVPDTSLAFPTQSTADKWLETVNSKTLERDQAFFDEQLQSILLIRLPHPDKTTPDPTDPPTALLEYIAHLQISLEATYISPHSAVASPPPASNTGSRPIPPRADSVGKVKKTTALNVLGNPSIFPPATPNPTPMTAEGDRKYVQAEGTFLLASIWGQGRSDECIDGERFVLVWSEAEKVWVGIYRLTLTVSFLRLSTSDPLLCLTISATLREKSLLQVYTSSHPLVQYLTTTYGYPPPSTKDATAPPSPSTPASTSFDCLQGLEEVNLLSGLAIGPNFPSSSSGETKGVYVPSTRLAESTRRTAFALSANTGRSQVESPVTATQSQGRATKRGIGGGGGSTLRKSFRKTMKTVSGFKVRMRTVFVPYVLLPSASTSGEGEAGTEERTVVLCVEIENSGESGLGIGFEVDGVEVVIGGEGAEAKLISWNGERGEEGVFPMKVQSGEQWNLLYAVGFMGNPDDSPDGFLLVGDTGDKRIIGGKEKELRRAVTINITGRPFTHLGEDQSEGYGYPTQRFSSRWNCILDLSPQPVHSRPSSLIKQNSVRSPPAANAPQIQIKGEALPEPGSPFPMSQSPHTATAANNFSVAQERGLAVRGSLGPGITVAGSQFEKLKARRAVMSAGAGPGPGGLRMSWMTPALKERERREREREANGSPLNPPSAAPQGVGSPTTYGPPSTPLSAASFDSAGSGPGTPIPGTPTPGTAGLPPMTPAYPAFPIPSRSSSAGMGHGPSGLSQSGAPISGQTGGVVGPSVEILRRGERMSPALVGAGQIAGGASTETEEGEPIVVSVGLIHKGLKDAERIYPLETFTLDIFVFNKTSWTRRFEISFPDRRDRRKQQEIDSGGTQMKGFWDGGKPGILPLENRIRIGPLRPSTCQSVRMDFLAVSPGVHSIDTLTLTDIATGYAMNLRSVMDVVIHEFEEEDDGD